MARKKAHAEHENHERWLVSYADFITLLFAFFVVMFATSQTDKAKAQQVSESVQKALENGGIKAVVHEILGGTVDDKGKGNAQMRGPGGAQKQDKESKDSKIAELMPSMHYLTKELEAEIKQGKIQVSLQPRGLVVSLQEAAFFPSGADSIAADTYPTMQKIADLVTKLPNPIRLEGHTDSIPIHTARFRSNWDLSAARAIAMLDLLSGQFELPRGRFSIAGYADTAPVDTNETPEGRARNRRVDIVFLNQQALIGEPAPPKPAAAPPAAPAQKKG
ncbi:MAG: flagellar basal body stator protein MotB [Terriglobia bacterium]|nr:MAG: flagellar basal body stator protein MotB [Terriglobia bacterium]